MTLFLALDEDGEEHYILAVSYAEAVSKYGEHMSAVTGDDLSEIEPPASVHIVMDEVIL